MPKPKDKARVIEATESQLAAAWIKSGIMYALHNKAALPSMEDILMEGLEVMRCVVFSELAAMMTYAVSGEKGKPPETTDIIQCFNAFLAEDSNIRKALVLHRQRFEMMVDNLSQKENSRVRTTH